MSNIKQYKKTLSLKRPPSMKPFQSTAVAAAFDGYPKNIRVKLMKLREIIFEVAAATSGVGAIEESLKWGEPAYLTAESRSGSTIRIAWKKSAPAQYAMYFICSTNLIETFRTLFPNDFKYVGNRAIIFEATEAVPNDAVRFCIAAALTYRKKAVQNMRSGGRHAIGSALLD